jgi:hypothetical protein
VFNIASPYDKSMKMNKEMVAFHALGFPRISICCANPQGQHIARYIIP